MTIAQLQAVSTEPAGPSYVAPSISYVSGRMYLVIVAQVNLNSLQPSVSSISGLGVPSWTAVSLPTGYYDQGAPSLRKVQAFRGVATSSGTGGVTVNQTNCEALFVTVIESDQSDNIVQVKDATFTSNISGSLAEPVAMAAANSADNRWVAYVAGNVAVTTGRFELDADAGGDADWTSFTIHTKASNPVGFTQAGYLNAVPSTDTTPGFRQTDSSPACYMAVFEFNKVTPPPPAPPNEWVGGGIVWEVGGTAPPPTQPLLIGATIDRVGSETWAQATNNFNANLQLYSGRPGVEVEITRRFISAGTPPAPPTNWNNHGALTVDTNQRHRIISWKGWPTQAQNETFMATIPDDGFITYTIVHHEPENDGGIMTPTYFKELTANHHAAWVALGRPDHIKPGICLMSWLERDNNASTSSAQWFPDQSIIADMILWLDPYDETANRTLEQKMAQTYALWIAAGGDPSKWGITETGTKRLGTDGANWIRESIAYCRANDAIAWCWFHSDVGANGPWYLTDPLMWDAMADEIAANG